MELAAGLVIGQFVARDRAEVAIFLAFRPWVLLGLVAYLSGAPLRMRLAGYALALLAAALGEAMLVWSLGGDRVVTDAVRGVLAGMTLALLLDIAFGLSRQVEPRFATLLGVALGVGLLLVPGPVRVFEWIALRPEPAVVSGPRPALTLLTGLPIVWGEDGKGGPNAAARRLAATFTLRPIDAITPEALRRAPLLLAAQPRELSSPDIEAIDAWLRDGGRAVMLADPDLRWPVDLSPGDARRPPRWATLAPLLARWGVTVARTTGRVATIDFARPGGGRRVVVDSPGIIRAERGCRISAGGRAADCVVGRGRALILADADLLDDRLWVAPGTRGDSRIMRGGDNALLIADWLDDLAGLHRDRPADSVSWMRPSGLAWAMISALLPSLLLGLFAAAHGSSHLRR